LLEQLSPSLQHPSTRGRHFDWSHPSARVEHLAGHDIEQNVEVGL
jgi:hypothetical protein